MADFNYNDIIEYIDCTRDLNFEAAQNWAKIHNTTFNELIDKRETRKVEEEYEEDGETKTHEVEKLFRYFQIGQEPQPYVPTPEELIRQEIWQLKDFLAQTDYVVIKIAEGEEPSEHALEVIAERKKARARINELEAELEPKEESGE